MPSFTYRCPLCRTSSPRALTYAEALAEQTLHRGRVHGGHIPDGDSITVRRTERWSEADPLERYITVILVAVVLLVLVYKTT